MSSKKRIIMYVLLFIATVVATVAVRSCFHKSPDENILAEKRELNRKPGPLSGHAFSKIYKNCQNSIADWGTTYDPCTAAKPA